jgi:hypothetical protein
MYLLDLTMVSDFSVPAWSMISLVSVLDLIASAVLDVLLIVKGGAYDAQLGCLSSLKKLYPDSRIATDKPQEEKKSEGHEHSNTAGGITEETEQCKNPYPNQVDDGIEDGVDVGAPVEIVTEVNPDGSRRTIETFLNPDGSKTISITTEQPNEYDNMQVRRSICTEQQNIQYDNMQVRSAITNEQPNQYNNMQVRRSISTEQPNQYENVQALRSIPLKQPSENDIHSSSRGRDPSIIKVQPNVSIPTEQPTEYHDDQGKRGMDP